MILTLKLKSHHTNAVLRQSTYFHIHLIFFLNVVTKVIILKYYAYIGSLDIEIIFSMCFDFLYLGILKYFHLKIIKTNLIIYANNWLFV